MGTKKNITQSVSSFCIIIIYFMHTWLLYEQSLIYKLENNFTESKVGFVLRSTKFRAQLHFNSLALYKFLVLTNCNDAFAY